jgi:hypothetical protein
MSRDITRLRCLILQLCGLDGPLSLEHKVQWNDWSSLPNGYDTQCTIGEIVHLAVKLRHQCVNGHVGVTVAQRIHDMGVALSSRSSGIHNLTIDQISQLNTAVVMLKNAKCKMDRSMIVL